MLAKSRVKYIQSLGQKKFRDSEGLFIAEGPKLVEELLASSYIALREILATEEWLKANKKLASGVPFTQITESELERISQLKTPNKVLALALQTGSEFSVVTKGNFTLALDDIQDPGNMGTILRIADWFGIKQVICSRETADIYNSKVVQASMGSIARVKVKYVDLGEWLSSQKETRIFAALLEGQDITKMQKPEEGIILFGNESRGIHPELVKLANEMITIPKKGKAESLNAAVAAGIILSHFC